LSIDFGVLASKVPDNTPESEIIQHLLMPSPPRLLDQVKEAIRLKHFSLKTEKSDVH
jgi:hypothetical protein